MPAAGLTQEARPYGGFPNPRAWVDMALKKIGALPVSPVRAEAALSGCRNREGAWAKLVGGDTQGATEGLRVGSLP